MIKETCLAALVAFFAFAAPAAADEPQSTTATYGTWQLRCQTTTVAGKSTKHCEIAQTIQVKGQTKPLVQVALGPQNGADTSLALVLLTPIGVWLPEAPVIALGDKGPPVSTTFKRCLPSACFSDVSFTDKLKARFVAKGDAQGSIIFHPDEGKDAKIPISFKGFSDALTALLAEIKTK